VAVGYVQCGCQQLQSVHAVCWSVERTDTSWGVTGLQSYNAHLVHVI